MTESSPCSVGLAHHVLNALARTGVREWVVCAGARNALMVNILAQTLGCRVWHFPEERSAAFFALGRTLRLGQPVAVVTTSGTAVAEVLPALIEAHYQGLPLVVLSADRPTVFRGSGAPQAIEQAGLAGPFAEALDVEASLTEAQEAQLARWSRSRPLHVNLCLPEPRAVDLKATTGLQLGMPRPVLRDTDALEDAGAATAALEAFLAPGGAVAVVGALTTEAEREAALRLILKAGLPVLAEATSGLREHPAVLGQRVSAREITLADRVVRLGGVPTSRCWRDLESLVDVPVLSLTHTGFSGLGRGSTVLSSWITAAMRAQVSRQSPRAKPHRSALGWALEDFPLSEPAWFRALSQAIPDGSHLFLGNSLPIREWDDYATTEDRSLRCWACRGANGIDGQLSAFFGLSANFSGNDVRPDRVRDSRMAPEWWAVVGDLTAVYDLAAPWVLPQLPGGKRRLVIVNNGGGKIFRRVPPMAAGLVPSAWPLMENPHQLSFAPLAALWGLHYILLECPNDLQAKLASLPLETTLIEIRPDPTQTEASWAARAATAVT
jgi:2-succinyl-5-enolpyruvyl-6-hydroxy-3-cyclohexene-1-carboxylate synthase